MNIAVTNQRIAYDQSEAKYLFDINPKENVVCKGKTWDEKHQMNRIVFVATSYKKAIEFFQKIEYFD